MFNSSTVKTFRFTEAFFREEDHSAVLRYSFDNSHSFEERFVFHGLRDPLTKEQTELVNRAVRQLHLAAGISYFKAAVPPKIEIENQSLSEEVTIDKAAQYKQYRTTFTIDYDDEGGGAVEAGDMATFRLNFDATNSDIADIIVTHFLLRYKTAMVGLEI